ncbi:YadA-like family protein [Actinobacillus delphinicola]|uniref:Autotransporter adhesin n=1 Tax=Actinobacillus delphinicola TaxID=51161 RepID=A0A448TW81_9PAST|nr:YadA-like family protein [Actinobacillus delphinicola]VEJ10205.1 autotransporter adhesin [Actinobacillus delphinicola]
MNKIFKVIFNKTTQRFVVVSELGKSTNRDKSQVLTKTTSLINRSIHSIFMLSLAALTVQNAMADSVAIGKNEYFKTTATSWDKGAAQGNAVASGENSVAVGNNSSSGGTVSVAVGSLANSSGYGSVAIGNVSNSQGGYSTALGGAAQAVGLNSTALGNTSSAAGNNTVAVGYSANAQSDNSTAIGEGSQATAQNSSAFGNSAIASGNNALAVGIGAQATALDTTVLGTLAKATQQNAIAIGANALAQGAESIAQGNEARAMMDQSIAIGYNTSAESNNKQASRGIAIGYNTHAENEAALAIGSSSMASADSSTAIGRGAIAAGNAAIAIGNYTSNEIKQYSDVQDVPLTLRTLASGNNSLALGSSAHAMADDSVALGSNSVADRTKGLEGYDVSLPSSNGISPNTSPIWKATEAAIAVGNGAKVTRQITGVAAGTKDTDAVNVAQLKQVKSQYVADNGSIISRKPSEVLSLTGGATTGVADSIKTTGDANGTIRFQVSNTLNGMNKITFGMPNQANSNDTVSISTNGISAGNKVISNVASGGTTTTNAANIGDIDKAINPIKKQVGENQQNILDNKNNIKSNKSSINTINEKLNNGLSFVADNHVAVSKKLGQTLELSGGANQNNLTNNNIGVNVENGKINIQLAKDIKGLNSIIAGSTKIDTHGVVITNGPSITTAGIDAGNQVISNVESGGNTDTNAANIGDVKKFIHPIQIEADQNKLDILDNLDKIYHNVNLISDNTNKITSNQKAINNVETTVNKGISFSADSGNVNKKLGGTLHLTGGANKSKLTTDNIGVNIDNQGNVHIQLAKDLTGLDSIQIKNGPSITTSGINAGNKVISNVASGGKTATNAANIGDVQNAVKPIKTELTQNKKDIASNLQNIDTNKEKIAENAKNIQGNTSKITTNENSINTINTTLEKGISFSGDTGHVNKKLGETLEFIGGAKQTDLTKGNIGVNVENGKIDIQLAKDLKGLDSVTVGNTKINNQGISITGGPSITTSGINAGAKVISNVASGGTTTTNAANIGDVQNAVKPIKTELAQNKKDIASNLQNIDTNKEKIAENTKNIQGNTSKITTNENSINTINTTLEKGISFSGDTGHVNKKLGETLEFIGGAKQTDLTKGNIGVNVENGKIDIQLAKDLKGLDSVTVGNTKINNQGISITGGPSITTSGINAGAKVISNVASGGDVGTNAANISDVKRFIAPVQSEVNTNKLNIKNNSNKIDENATKIANNVSSINTINSTLDKGLTFIGDSGKVNEKLGDTLHFTGGANKSKLTTDNIGVNIDKQGNVNIQLAKDLKGLDSVAVGNTTINTQGITITGGPSITTSGINADNKVISNVASGGKTATNAANIGDVQNAVNPIKEDVQVNTNEITDLKNNTIQLGGNNNSTTDKQKLSQANGIKFDILGTDGINTQATANKVTLSLDKATVRGLAQEAIKVVDGQHTTVTEKTVGNTKQYAVNVKTDGSITTGNKGIVTGGVVKAALDDQVLGYSANKDAKATSPQKTVKLSEGLDFNNGQNTTVTVGNNGQVTYNIKSDLTNIHSIANQGTKIALGDNGVTMSNGRGADVQLHGIQAGTNATDAANVGQLTKVAGNTDEISVETSTNTTGGKTYTLSLAPQLKNEIAQNKAEASKHSSIVAENDSLTVTHATTNTAGGTEYKVAVNLGTVSDSNQTQAVSGSAVKTYVDAKQFGLTAGDGQHISKALDDTIVVKGANNQSNIVTKIENGALTIGLTQAAQNKLQQAEINKTAIAKIGNIVGMDGIIVSGNPNVKNGTVTLKLDNAVVQAEAKKAIKVVSGNHTSVTETTDGTATHYAVNVVTNGEVKEGNTGIVTGGVVKTALDDQVLGYSANKDAKATSPQKTVKLSEGLDFKNGQNTTVTVGDNGQVTYDINSRLTDIHSIANQGAEIALDNNGVTMSNGHGADVQLHGIQSGTNSTDAANVGQLTQVTGTNGEIKVTGTKNAAGGKTYTVNIDPSLKQQINDNTAQAAKHSEVISPDHTISVTQNAETAAGGKIYQVEVNKGNIAVNATTGVITQPTDADSNKFVDAKSLSAALSHMGFVVKSGSDKVNEGQIIHSGNEITFTAGDNMQVIRNGSTFTFATSKTPTFNSITVGNSTNNPIIINQNGINAGDKVISHVKSGGTIADNAANIGDVQSAVNPIKEATQVNHQNITKLQNNTLQIGAGNNTVTDTQKLSKAGGLKFDIVGEDGVNTTATGNEIKVSLDKDSVRHLAQEAVKVIDGTHTTVTTGKAGNATTYQINVKTDGKVVNGNEGIVTGGAVKTALDNQVIGYSANKKADATQAQQTIKLSQGLDFINGTNTTAKVEAGGKVTYNVNANLTGMSSIAGNGSKIIFNKDGITLGNSAHQAPIVLHGVKAGEQNTDAANVGQLTKVKGTTGQLDVGISGTTATGKTYTISLDPAVTQHIQTNTIEAKKHSSVVAEGNGLTVTNTTENSVGGTEYKVALKLGDVASTNTTQAVSGSAVKTYVDAQEFGLTAGDNNTLSHHLGNAISVKGADNQANIVTKIENGALTIGLTKAAQDKLQQADTNKNAIANIGDIVGDNGITVTGNANVKNGAVTLKLNDNVVRGLAKEAVKVTHGKNTTVTASTVGDATNYAVNVITDGQVKAGNNGIVTGNTVHAALMPMAKDIAGNKTQIQQNAHTINQGLQFGADSATATGANPVTNKLGSQIDIKGDGKNIHTTVAQTISNGKTDTIISVNLAKNLTDLSGVHIANGPSMTTAGINAGDKQITHVASGLQGQSIDKATGSTLQNAANIGDIQTAIKPIEQDVATNKQDITTNKTTIVRNTQRIDTVQSTLNKGLSFSADSGNVNKRLGDTLHFAGGADKAKLTDHNIGVNVENGVIQIQLAKNLTGLDSVTVGNTKLDNTGITITGGPSITSTGINAGDKQITNVASGLGHQTLDDADSATLMHAANIGDLKNAIMPVKEAVNVNKTSITALGNNTIVLGGDKNSRTEQQHLNKQHGLQFNIVGNDDIVTTASGDQVAVQLSSATKAKIDHAADNDLSNLTSKADKVITGLGTIVKTDGIASVSETQNAQTGQATYTVTVQANGHVAAGDQNAVSGDTVHKALVAGNAALTDKGFSLAGDAGNTVHKNLGETIKLAGDTNITTTGVNQAGEVKITLNKALKNLNSVQAGNTTLNNDGVTIANGPAMTSTGINAGNKQITNVASGLSNGQTLENATQTTLQHAANLGDLKTAITPIQQAVTHNQTSIATNKTTIDNVQTQVNKGLNFVGDNHNAQNTATTINEALGGTLSIVGGADKSQLTDNNIGVNVENGKIRVQLAQNLTHLTGVHILNGPAMTTAGINAANKQITDVASGLGQGQTLENADQATLRHAANIADLKQAVTTVKTDMSNQTLAYSANNTAAKPQKTVKLSEGLNFFNGSNTTVTVADNGKVTYNLNSALTNIQSVSGENAQIALGKNGITVGDKAHAPVAIHGVKAGQAQTDATNVGQLTKVEGQSKEVIVKGTANATGGTTYHVSLAPNVTQAIADNKAEAAKHSEVISENHSLNITADKTTATGGKIYNVEVATTNLNVANGKVVMPSHQAENNVDAAASNKFVTAGNMANVLNNIGFTLQAQGKNGSLIKAGSQVNLANTDGNIHIEKTATNGDVTFNLNKSLNLDAQNQGSVSGLQNHLVATTDAKAVSPTISTQIEHQAATVGDVLHAGWNIAQGTVNKGVINPYNTVSFANGNATTATVSTEKNGQVSVKYGVNVDDNTIKIKDGKLEAIIPKNTAIMDLQVGADNTQNSATQKVAPITLDQKNHAISILGTDNEVTTQVVGNNVKVALASKVKNELAKGLLHTTVSKGNNITITPTKATATQGANYQVSLNADLNGIASIRNGDTATGTQITLDAHSKNVNVHDAHISQIQSAIADQSGQNYLDKLHAAQNQATTAQDAVNVTDLANTATALNNTIANKVTNLEMQYQGDNTQVTIKRKPSEILTLNGGATSGLDDSIQTVGNANGSITFKVSKTLNGMSNITFEKPADSQSNSPAVSIGKNGISAGNQQIKHVLSGGDIDTNAANIGDVKKAIAPVQQQVTQNKASIELNTNALNKMGTVEIAGDGGLEITSANKNLKDGNVTISLNSISVANHLMDSAAAKNALQAGLGDGENKAGDKGLINGNTLHDALGNLSDGIKAQGLNFVGDNYQAADTNTQIHKPLGSTLTIVGGASKGALTENNIGVNVENGEMKVQLAKELKGLLSVQAGSTVLNDNGVTIKNGPSITKQGIDAAYHIVRNVSAGNISDNSNDAINGSQFKKLGNLLGLTTNAAKTGFNLPHFHSLKDIMGANTVAPTSFTGAIDNLTDVVNKGFIFEGNSSHVGKHGNQQYLGSTLHIVGSTVPIQDDSDYSSQNLTTVYVKDAQGNGKIIIKMDDKPTFKAVTLTNGAGATVVSPDGLTIEDQAGKSHISLTQQGLNNGGHVISNVHAGKNVTDAVNVGQLDHAKADLTNSGLQFGADKASTATGSNPVTNKLGSRVDIKGDDQNISTTVSQNAQTGDTTIKVKLAPKISVDSVHAKDNIQIGDNVTINRNGLTIKNGPSLTTDGLNNDNKQIINVASGLGDTKLSDAKGSMLTNAVNVGDLKQAVKDMDTHISDQVNKVGLKYKANDGKTHHLNLNNDVLTFKDGKNTKASINANGEVSYDVAPDLTGIKTISGGPNGAKISLSQNDKTISIHGGKLTDVAKGRVTKDSTDAVNGGQLFDTNQKVAENTANIQSNTTMLKHGLNLVGNSGSGNQQLGSTLKIEGSAKDENATYSSDNITTTYQQDDHGNGVVKVEMKDNPTFKSVDVAGNNGEEGTHISSKGVTVKSADGKDQVSVTAKGLNNGGNVISNVADGKAPTDAVNRRQLDKVEKDVDILRKGIVGNVGREISDMQQRISKNRKEANAGSAAAIAAANLPQPFLAGRSMVSAAVGSYRNQQAISVGLSRISDNGKWIIKSSLSEDTQHNFGVGAGFGYQW